MRIPFLVKARQCLLKIGYVLKELPGLIKNGIALARREKNPNSDTIDNLVAQFGRALILLDTPDSDYLYATLDKNDEKLLK